MLRNLRLEMILKLVDEKEYVSLHELMKKTSSSESTIRGDLVALEKEGKIIRLHGGAKSIKQNNSSLTELNMNEKSSLNVEQKILIAKYAANLIKDNTLVYIDAGTTTSFLCDYISSNGNIFVTNSMTIAQKLTKRNYKVYVTGGEIKLSTDAFVGSFPIETIKRFTFDLGFFGSNAISLKQGYTTPDYEEAIIKKTALERSNKAYVLADSSKLGFEQGVKFASFQEATLITDKITNEEYKKENVLEVNN